MNRIDNKFKVLREQGKKAMIPFITAGDPDLDTTIDLVLALEEAGADIIELGIPYSDPLADGPIIQASSNRAIQNGARIPNIMETVRRLREHTEVPLVYLVYYNSIFRYGIERFLRETMQAGVDGLIIPDLPMEERAEIIGAVNEYNIDIIPLVAPTSKERIGGITQNGKGFVYCVSTSGVTGTRQDLGSHIEEYMHTVAAYTDLPKALGFGISGSEMAEKYKAYCDGIIIGSAVIKKIAEAKTKDEAVTNVKAFAEAIRRVL